MVININTQDLVQFDYDLLPEWIQSSQLCVTQCENVDINKEAI